MLDCFKIKHLSIAIIAVVLNLESGCSVLAQIAPDRTLGDESSVVTPNVEVKGETADRIDGGAIRDRNLFHSFTEFNVEQGQRAYFANPNNIEQIFTRITGSNPSNINGTLGVDGAADLLLLNPNGIIFGENSSLDLEGSFFGTSADGVLFEDETEFDAVESNSTLLTISVPVGLQIGNNPGSILVRSPLTLANGRDFSLVGGEVNLTGNDINTDEDGANSAADGIIAPGGRVQLAGLLAEGIVRFNNDGNLVLPENVSRADINLNNYFINASAGGGGSIALQSKNLRLIDSFIISGINSNVESTDAQAGDITIDTSDATILRANENSASVILNVTGENITGDLSEFELSTDNSAAINVSGNAGNISIDTNSLSASGLFVISSLTNGEGNAGNISINASDSITLDLSDPIDIELPESTALATIASIVGELGTGDGANISINAGSLSFNNTVISTSTIGAGNAGNTSIKVDSAITANNGIVTADSIAAGDGGNIRIEGRSLSTENTRISTSTAGAGNAGNTSIDATDSISFVNTEVVAETFSGGDAGNIVFESKTASISLEDSAISTTVAPPIEELVATGRGGDLTIYGRDFLATNSLVASATGGMVTGEGLANAGDLTLSISDSITISDRSLFFTNTVGEGNAGDLFVKTRNLNLFKGGQILASSSGIGNSGTINIEANEIEIAGRVINLINNEEVTFPSGISATTEDSSDGGVVNITARNLSIADGAAISVRSLGDGNAGSIFTQIDNSLELNNGTFSSRSDRSSGGEIEVAAGDIRLRGNSNIQTNVENGAGGGGNITLTADSIVTFDDSDIFAFATDGVGGNITLDTNAFFVANYNPAAFNANPQLLDNNNRVDLNASGSVFGIVDTPEVNFLPNSLAELSEDTIDTKKVIANSCAMRGGKGGGTFIVTGSGGLPSRPGDAAVVDYATGTVRSISDRRSVITDKNWQPGDSIVEPEKIYRLSNGKLILSRECS